MKKIKALLILLITIQTTAQQISYELIENSPENIPKTNINIGLFNLDMNEMLKSSSLNADIWGYQNIIPNKLSIDFDLKKSWLAVGRMSKKTRTYSGNLSLDLGLNYNILSFQKNKELKILLNKKYIGLKTTGSKTIETYEETSIKIPGTVITKFAARAGFSIKRNAYEYTDLQGLLDLTKHGGAMTNKGGYIGASIKKYKNVGIKTERYGTTYNTKATEFYCDLLILPSPKFVNTIAPAGSTGFTPTDETELIKDNTKNSPIGLRFGARIHPIAGYKQTGIRFPFAFIFEFGARPYIGKYMNVGISFNLIKIK